MAPSTKPHWSGETGITVLSDFEGVAVPVEATYVCYMPKRGSEWTEVKETVCKHANCLSSIFGTTVPEPLGLQFQNLWDARLHRY
ncbi:hypothetical protein K443DRAFT_684750 [Laccaria amethystina LaAM-08-1]|uniref:Uncharacterized protein n=1 Tax=Laccaria amethystina LaAM-08-1 TaxID=1095629 RepID=A0A0C9XA44_9AGAR|nr:hypothetical protein K443DRAFT_684750 [Laccaria amethystina LaAM-08-1]